MTNYKDRLKEKEKDHPACPPRKTGHQLRNYNGWEQEISKFVKLMNDLCNTLISLPKLFF